MKKKVLIFLVIITLAFIWIHSAMSLSASKAESSEVTEFIRPVMELFVGKGNVTENLVRKLAHFAEYAVYGIEMALLIVANWIGWRNRKTGSRMLLCMNVVLITAFIDETIQIFSGRGPEIVDVWIDLAGAAFTMLLVTIGTVAGRRKRG